LPVRDAGIVEGRIEGILHVPPLRRVAWFNSIGKMTIGAAVRSFC
jgi:hypothetical protein